jgi:hypothetical protein
MIDFGPPPKLAKPALILPKPADIIRPGDPRFVAPGMFVATGLTGFGARLSTTATQSFIAATGSANGINVTSHSFTSQSYGSGSHIVIYVYTRRNGGGTPSGWTCTVGGNSATLLDSQASTNSGSAMFIIANPSPGGSGTIAVGLGQSMERCSIAVFSVNGLQSMTAVDTDKSTSNNPSITSTTNNGGVVIAGMSSDGGASCTWTGLTERSDATYSSGFGWMSSASADIVTGGSLAVSVAGDTGSSKTFICVSLR